MWGRLRDNCGRFIGEIMRFRKVADGLLTPGPNIGRAGLLPPLSPGIVVFAGEPPERSKTVELEFFCLPGHMSSLCPGVSGVNRSATNKSNCIFGGELKEKFQ